MAAEEASFRVGGWVLTRDPGLPRANPSVRLRQAEELRRWADAEAAEAATALHDDAQRMIPRHLAGTKSNPGMAISVRTGTLVTELGYEAAVEEIAAVRDVSVVTARMDLDRSEVLTNDLREVLGAWKSGQIGSAHVRVLAQQALKIQPRKVPEPSGTEATEAALEEWARSVDREQRSVRAARNELGRKLLADASGRTPGEVDRRARRLLEKYDPLSFSKRSVRAQEQRSVRLERGRDGMAYLTAHIESAKAEAIWDRLHRHATMLRQTSAPSPTPVFEPFEVVVDPGTPRDPRDNAAVGMGPVDARTMDQLRADTFTDHLLSGPKGSGLENVAADVIIAIPSTILPGTPGGPDASPAVTPDGPDQGESGRCVAAGPVVPVSDALLSPGADLPEILGSGPVDQASAAQLMRNAKTWTRVVTDPFSGATLNWGRKRYRPTKAQRRALLFRHHTCCIPGCGNRGKYAQADHTIEWQDGGKTDMGNLALLCTRCHRLKSLGVLRTSLTTNGTLTATSLWGTARSSRPDAPWATEIDPAPPTGGCTLASVVMPLPETAWRHPDLRLDGHDGDSSGPGDAYERPPVDVEERMNATLFASPEATLHLPPIDGAEEVAGLAERGWLDGEASRIDQENQKAWDSAAGDLYPWFQAEVNTMDRTPASDPANPQRHVRNEVPMVRRQPLTRMRPRPPLAIRPGHDATGTARSRQATDPWATRDVPAGTGPDSDPPF